MTLYSAGKQFISSTIITFLRNAAWAAGRLCRPQLAKAGPHLLTPGTLSPPYMRILVIGMACIVGDGGFLPFIQDVIS